MNLYATVIVILCAVIGTLLGILLAIIKTNNKQVMELARALMAKNLTDYTVNTVDKDKGESMQEVPDIVPAEQMTEEEFDRQIKEQTNG